MTWNAAEGAATYALRESFNNPNLDSAVTVYSGAGTSWQAAGKAPGTYYYQVRATNGWGSSSWSNVQSVVVQPPLPEIPVLNTISNPDGGSYGVTWNPAARATGYTLRESRNDPSFGSPVTVYSGAGTSWSASGKPLGTYYYSVQAWNALGSSGWSNVQSVVVALPTRFVPIADATVISSVPDFHAGSYDDMLVGYDHCSGSANGIWRSLVRFDLSAVPRSTSITNARLYVYLIESCDMGNRTHTVKTSRITGDWSEGGVAWSNKPGTGTEYGSATISSRSWGWYSFDVTQLVRGWLNGSFTNYGVMLRGPESSGDSSASLGFATREYGGDEVPYLSITYAGLAASEPASVPVTASQPLVCGASVTRRLWTQGLSPDSFSAIQACADR